jgi:hypothetical protein
MSDLAGSKPADCLPFTHVKHRADGVRGTTLQNNPMH